MKTLTTLAGGSLLLLATPALAQEPAPTDPLASPADTATEPPADTATAPDPASEGEPAFDVSPPAAAVEGAGTTFTDDQVTAFAQSAAAIQALPGEDGPEKQQRAREIVAAHGITAETYNAIGAAMQTDAALAARVQIALETQAPASPAG